MLYAKDIAHVLLKLVIKLQQVYLSVVMEWDFEGCMLLPFSLVRLRVKLLPFSFLWFANGLELSDDSLEFIYSGLNFDDYIFEDFSLLLNIVCFMSWVVWCVWRHWGSSMEMLLVELVFIIATVLALQSIKI